MKLLAGVLMLLIASACATPALQPVEPVESYVYRLGPGDRLRITTFGETALTGEYALNGEGAIAFPLIGDVTAGGKTTAQVREELTAKLGARYLRDPKISVEVVNYRPVFVLGEVAKPGEFPFAERMTAFSLIAKAGGFTYRANRKIAYVRHENDVDERAYPLTGSLAVRPGDTVRIGERYF